MPTNNIIKMRIIPKPPKGARGILKSDGTNQDIIFATGKGGNDYVCGKCEKLICKNICFSDKLDMVFLCPKCNSYNELYTPAQELQIKAE